MVSSIRDYTLYSIIYTLQEYADLRHPRLLQRLRSLQLGRCSLLFQLFP